MNLQCEHTLSFCQVPLYCLKSIMWSDISVERKACWSVVAGLELYPFWSFFWKNVTCTSELVALYMSCILIYCSWSNVTQTAGHTATAHPLLFTAQMHANSVIVGLCSKYRRFILLGIRECSDNIRWGCPLEICIIRWWMLSRECQSLQTRRTS